MITSTATAAAKTAIVFYGGYQVELNLCPRHLAAAHEYGTVRETGPRDPEDVCDLCEPTAAI